MDYLRGIFHGIYLPHRISDFWAGHSCWWHAAVTGLTAVATVHLVLRLRHKFFPKDIEGQRRAYLEGKVVLITGASSGLGRSLAIACYLAGAKVILAARSLNKLSELCQELVDLPKVESAVYHPPVYRHLDLAAPSDRIEATVTDLFAMHGRVDVLINNAGQSHRGTVLATTMEVHRKLMEVNYFGHLSVTLAILHLRGSGRGEQPLDIVNISSVQGRLAIPYRSAYAASKHAYQAFFDCARAELHDANVHVLVVSPGYLRTDLSLNAVTAEGSKYAKMDETTKGGMEPSTAASRILEALADRQEELLLLEDLPAKLAIVIRSVAPNLYFWLMAKRAAKERARLVPVRQ